jgi:hypothetical protein
MNQVSRGEGYRVASVHGGNGGHDRCLESEYGAH